MHGRSIMLLALIGMIACGGSRPTPTTTTLAANDPPPAAAAPKDSNKAAPKSAAPAARASFDTAAAAGARPLVREVYHYEGTRRDPFRPLVEPADRGPSLPDLRLVAIIYDASDPGRSLATFRDIGNDHRYTLNSGERLGRLSVVTITATTVKLREDDFGTAHDQTYSLRKPEDEKP